MKLRLYSDLHLDLHRDRGKEWLSTIEDKDNIDVLILAGDITNALLLHNVLGEFCKKFKSVIYIFGNHEYWGNIPHKEISAEVKRCRNDYKNLFILDDDVCVIDGQRFVGSTLWFPQIPKSVSFSFQLQKIIWSDFVEVSGGSFWIYEKNKAAKKFLNKNIKRGDVVITHHLPSQNCVAQQYLGHSNNCFYVCDMHDLIVERKPKLHVHGHSHAAMRHKIGDTQIVCNPLGYIGYNERTGFDEGIIIEV